MKVYKEIDVLWKKSSVPLPIKGNAEYEKYEEMIKKDWEGVAESERRPVNSTFDVNRMHYGEIPVNQQLKETK